jgi:Bacterial Ig domain
MIRINDPHASEITFRPAAIVLVLIASLFHGCADGGSGGSPGAGSTPGGGGGPTVSDTTPPTVAITGPGNGVGVSGSVTLQASANDNVGVVGVRFRLDGANIGVEDLTPPYEIQWNSTATSDGPHTLSAVARDGAGNTAAASITVTVSGGVGTGGWQPPIGIPMPTFGIVETAPARPSPWISAVPGYYYVDATHANATDTNNPYGTPAQPRLTIPNLLGAGSYVELNGIYARDHVSPRGLELAGTSNAPVWIRAADPQNPPVITRWWEIVNSSYFVLEHLRFADDASDTTNAGTLTGKLFFYGQRSNGTAAPVSFGVVRHSEFSGNINNGGLGFNIGLVYNVVLWDNHVHDNGDVNDPLDQDVHGITIGGRGNKHNIWVVDNEMARNSGDGLQINGGTESLNAPAGTAAVTESSIHHIYVGRNYSHHNKQTGMWSKQAQDVVFSENTTSNHRPSSSASGACMGYQYGPDRVWFIANRMFGCDYGIQGQSDSGLGFASPSVYVIGNVIHGIHWSDAFSSQAGYMFRSGGPRHIVGNTFYDVDKGIDSQNASTGTIEISNNLFANVNAAGSSSVHAIVMVSGTLANATTLRNNLFAGPFEVTLGGTSFSSVAALNNGTNRVANLEGAHGLTDPAAQDFHLVSGALAVDAGTTSGVYQTFFNRYGISIATDASGIARPQGGAWDIGAYER